MILHVIIRITSEMRVNKEVSDFGLWVQDASNKVGKGEDEMGK